MRSLSQRCLRIALLALVALAARPGLADGILRDSLGAVSSGRGGASIAVPDSGSVISDNPGALLGLPSRELLELRLDSYLLDAKYTDPENSAGGPFHPSVIPELTWVRTHERWALGFSVFAPGGFSTQYSLRAPTIGDTPYEASVAFLKAVPALAVRVDEHWSVGATLGLAYASLSLDAPLFTQTGAFSGLPTTMDLDTDGVSIAASAGLYYQSGDPGNRLRFGVTYTHGTHFSLEGETTATFYGLGPDPIASEFDAKVEVDLPRVVGVGVAREWGRTQVALDLVWTDWASAFDDVPLRLEHASNPAFAGLTLRDRFPLDWNDRVSVRIGIERQLASGHVLRAGYDYHPNPARRSAMTPLIPVVLEHTFALGYSMPLGHWTLALAGQLSCGPSTHVRRSRIVGGEFDDSTLDGYALGFFVGFTYGFD